MMNFISDNIYGGSLGNFDIYRELLADINNHDLDWIKEKLDKEVEKENTYVIQL